MKEISLQMIDKNVSSDWWKKLIMHFIHVGDKLEIRCWKEEQSEIHQASMYGDLMEEYNEISIKGIVSKDFISELLKENPKDKHIYNKMTKYFTINIEHEHYRFCSAHYGTEIYLIGASDEDVTFFQDAIQNYTEEDFVIHISE